jgi:hypothetical protein
MPFASQRTRGVLGQERFAFEESRQPWKDGTDDTDDSHVLTIAELRCMN